MMYIFYYLQELTVTDDTVLEEHSEDPALVQMTLLGDGGESKFILIIYLQYILKSVSLFCLR